ncbi:MAG: hypothetical protein QM270_05260 [Bacillota bacterium]|nr:hypothetical protein [Bacillota bacterium]
MKYLRARLSSDSLRDRVLWTSILFLATFIGVVVISYYLLPEGLLKNKNPLQNWAEADSTLLLGLQIFAYNLLSVLVISLASLFGSKKEDEAGYLSTGYAAFFTLVIINSVVLGTWSFSVESEAVPLAERIISTFDLTRRAALWEMLGQLVITCAHARIAVVRSCGKKTEKRSMRDIRWSRGEKAALLLGLVLMLIGAAVESLAIHAPGRMS